MIKEIFKHLPIICFTTIIIAEIICGFNKDLISDAVGGLFLLTLFGIFK